MYVLQDRHIPRGGTRGQTEPLVPERVIVHAMGEYIKDDDGQVYYAVEWLKKLKCSAHILVAPDCTIIRCRQNNDEAIHAFGCNNDSLGIEFLVPGTHNYGTFLKAIKKPYLKQGQLEGAIEFVRKEWVEGLGILNYEEHRKADPRQIKKDPGDGFPLEEFLEGIGVTV